MGVFLSYEGDCRFGEIFAKQRGTPLYKVFKVIVKGGVPLHVSDTNK
jgi:hypothetical protein